MSAQLTDSRQTDDKVNNMVNSEILKNEDGSILVIGLFMLVLLTITGLSASRTSSIEVQIVGNERIYKQNLYMAEASALESAQRLDEGGEEMRKTADVTSPIWLLELSELPNTNDITDPSNWTDDYSQVSVDANTRFLTIFRGIESGGSLDMAKSRLFSYSIFGRSNLHDGTSTVEVGYKRAF